MPRRHGLGLRAQIILALTVAFVASFVLLGIAAVQLTSRARAADRVRHARATASAIASALDAAGTDGGASFDRLAAAVVGRGGIAGVEYERGGLAPMTRGAVGLGDAIEAPIASGGTVRLYLDRDGAGGAPLARLLLLYVAVTGGAILLLAYVALTYLIVRPVEALTQASERLASGRLDVGVPVRGAAEVARLAVVFNGMASELRSERLALEKRLAELEETTAELRSAQEQILRSARLASVGRLAAGVAHEIGNPLAAILGLVELVRAGGLEERERAEFLARIQSETERINSIIRDLLDFSRKAPDEDEASASADLREVVADAVHLIAPQKDLRAITVEQRLAEDLPRVRGGSDRLTQVVLNLLLNAADAIEGEGRITIEVARTDDGHAVALAVSDTGPGIAPEIRDTLFEPFVTTKPAGHGTGLGLAVCHTIVEQLGGTITASSAPEGGARFEVRLPAVSGGGGG